MIALIILFLSVVNSHKIISFDNFSIATYSNRDIVSNILNNQQHWEPHFLKEIDQVAINGGYNFLDIGANIGFLSFYALSKGLSVVAVEPMNENLKLLNISIHLNPHFSNNLKVYDVGLSNSFKDCDLTIDENINIGNGNLACDEISKRASNNKNRKLKENVRLIPLDNLIQELPRFDLIKIDVEGHEPHIFEGGKIFFSIHRRTPILMELSPTMIKEQNGDAYIFLTSLKEYYHHMLIYNSNREIINLYDNKQLKRFLARLGPNQVDVKLY